MRARRRSPTPRLGPAPRCCCNSRCRWPRSPCSRDARVRRGARVVLNAAPAAALPDDLLRSVDVLIVNENEAARIGAEHGLPAMPEDFAASASARYGCAVIVTLGARGALAAADDERIAIAAPPTRVVDTTGAGDAFAGALRRRSIAARACVPRWPRASPPVRSPAAPRARRQRCRSAAQSRSWQKHSDTVFISSPTEGSKNVRVKIPHRHTSFMR